jgi:hypothetical protein
MAAKFKSFRRPKDTKKKADEKVQDKNRGKGNLSKVKGTSPKDRSDSQR